MKSTLVKKDICVKPGFILLPNKEVKLYAVVGSSVVITIYDTKRKCGGMNHYIRPIRDTLYDSTPVYACPAIIGLIDMFVKAGSGMESLEAHIYGASSNPEAEGYIEGLAEYNLKVGIEILGKREIHITGRDVGGNRGRKVVFNSSTGESIVAKVDKIRSVDWYPQINDLG